MSFTGEVVKFSDNVDTDVILPGKYLVITDPSKLADHAMEGLDSAFSIKAKKGIIIVAGKNFGCGSSREQAPLALKYSEVKCVIAESFARIFFRNAINVGLPVLELEGASSRIMEGDRLRVELNSGIIMNLSKNSTLQASKLPEFILEILNDGGLIEHVKKKWSLK